MQARAALATIQPVAKTTRIARVSRSVIALPAFRRTVLVRTVNGSAPRIVVLASAPTHCPVVIVRATAPKAAWMMPNVVMASYATVRSAHRLVVIAATTAIGAALEIAAVVAVPLNGPIATRNQHRVAAANSDARLSRPVCWTKALATRARAVVATETGSVPAIVRAVVPACLKG